MSETTIHTPGPWRLCRARGGKCQCGLIWSETADCVVATVNRPPAPFTGRDEGYEGPTEEAALANARIIESAPTILEAAAKVCDSWEQHGDVSVAMFSALREAVAKATGSGAPVPS